VWFATYLTAEKGGSQGFLRAAPNLTTMKGGRDHIPGSALLRRCSTTLHASKKPQELCQFFLEKPFSVAVGLRPAVEGRSPSETCPRIFWQPFVYARFFRLGTIPGSIAVRMPSATDPRYSLGITCVLFISC